MSEPFFPAPLSPDEERHVLGRALGETKGFSLIFVLTNQAPDRMRHIVALRRDFPALNLVDVPIQEPISSLLNHLRSLATSPLPTGFLIYGIENWLTSKENANQVVFFRNLNAARNHFLKEFSCSLVFWIPQWLLEKFQQGCPDFLSIRSGIYQVTGEPGKERQVLMEQLSTSSMNAVYAVPQRERSSRAEELESLLIELESEPLGQQDQDAILQILDSLSILYYTTALYQQAEPLLKRALAIRESALGAEHPDTAGSLNNLAVLYYYMGKKAEAVPLLKRAFEIFHKSLGRQHPNTQTILQSLLGLLNDLGQWEDALPLLAFVDSTT